MSIYNDNGFYSRKEYLKALALEHDVPAPSVFAIADVLGEDEDFDGLITALEDYYNFNESHSDEGSDYPTSCIENC